MSSNGKLTLVGAGPGDPELITLKGARALAQADVVLYDALVAPELLSYAPGAEHIFVGKRKGCVAFLQDQIHELIVQRGLQGLHVVRLKGGDPFVFGRGSEELAYAAERGMEVRVIPGLSSSLAVPALRHIPLTLRGVSESFWVLTGTTKAHQMSRDIGLAARSSATVVVLMGMSHLPEIMAGFKAVGKGDMPVAVIQEGSTPAERAVVGSVSTIVELVAAAGLGNPAVIVVGHTVKQHSVRQSASLSLNQSFFATPEMAPAS